MLMGEWCFAQRSIEPSNGPFHGENFFASININFGAVEIVPASKHFYEINHHYQIQNIKENEVCYQHFHHFSYACINYSAGDSCYDINSAEYLGCYCYGAGKIYYSTKCC